MNLYLTDKNDNVICASVRKEDNTNLDDAQIDYISISNSEDNFASIKV